MGIVRIVLPTTISSNAVNMVLLIMPVSVYGLIVDWVREVLIPLDALKY
jgi:hypothetical protein